MVDLGPGEQRRLKLIAPGDAKSAEPPAGDACENERYRVAWAKNQGIVSLTDRATGTHVIDPAVGALGCPIYQLSPAGNRGAPGTVYPPRQRPQDEVTAGQCTAIKRVAAEPVYERWQFYYRALRQLLHLFRVGSVSGILQLEEGKH
jgi:hypothetical protein